MDIVVDDIRRSMFVTLETYSNVHRGSGIFSRITTQAFENAREVILHHFGLTKNKYVVIFCNKRRSQKFISQLGPEDYLSVSSNEKGLAIGVVALAVRKDSLGKIRQFQAGGGTARLVSRGAVIWGKIPDRFEAGTPAIVNIIAFANSLKAIRQGGNRVFNPQIKDEETASDILYRDDLEKYSGKELLDELVKTLIGKEVTVQTNDGKKKYINFDNGASTPSFMPVYSAACRAILQPENIKKEIVEEVRGICSSFLSAPQEKYDFIFTSNTTESINIVAESLAGEPQDSTEPVVLNTVLEHNSNDLPWRISQGVSLVRLPVDNNGFIDISELENILGKYNSENVYGKKRIRIVAVSGASNVLGTCNDLSRIGSIVHKYGARLLVDGAQMVSHREVNISICGIDYFVFSAHKMYAPFGTGVLVAAKGSLSFSKEEDELIRSSGEENIAGIAALGKAMLLLQRTGMNTILEKEQKLTAHMLRGMSQIPGIEIYGIKDPASEEFSQKSGVIAFNLKKIYAPKVANALSQQGIGIRYGCHCSHILIKQLVHIGKRLEKVQHLIVTLFPKINLPGVARVSLGLTNTEEEADILVAALGKISEKVKSEK